ncbi:cysteine-rich DPF motif domain-containing protein 1-like [Babylonia areolata]|uniref:cysteine-rich DPF motif domain-containing protein 1-like n=1 Tax=Babylonia areolata TaxID=304850 RepID=UPI003FD42291
MAAATKVEKSPEDKKQFTCSLCKFQIEYHYHGNKPPFAKALTLLEECYVMKDPFSTSGGLITLGSTCSLCHSVVCMSPDCSLFYSKRFCLPCVVRHLEEFPAEIQEEVSRKQKQESGS